MPWSNREGDSRGGWVPGRIYPLPHAPELVGFLGLTLDTSESLPPLHNILGKERWPIPRPHDRDKPQRGGTLVSWTVPRDCGAEEAGELEKHPPGHAPGS